MANAWRVEQEQEQWAPAPIPVLDNPNPVQSRLDLQNLLDENFVIFLQKDQGVALKSLRIYNAIEDGKLSFIRFVREVRRRFSDSSQLGKLFLMYRHSKNDFVQVEDIDGLEDAIIDHREHKPNENFIIYVHFKKRKHSPDPPFAVFVAAAAAAVSKANSVARAPVCKPPEIRDDDMMERSAMRTGPRHLNHQDEAPENERKMPASRAAAPRGTDNRQEEPGKSRKRQPDTYPSTSGKKLRKGKCHRRVESQEEPSEDDNNMGAMGAAPRRLRPRRRCRDNQQKEFEISCKRQRVTRSSNGGKKSPRHAKNQEEVTQDNRKMPASRAAAPCRTEYEEEEPEGSHKRRAVTPLPSGNRKQCINKFPRFLKVDEGMVCPTLFYALKHLVCLRQVTEEEAKFLNSRNWRGCSRKIIAGQVGLECKACSEKPLINDYEVGRLRFPSSLGRVYETIHNLLGKHPPHCKNIDKQAMIDYDSLKTCKNYSSKQGLQDACKDAGLKDEGKGSGLFWEPDID